MVIEMSPEQSRSQFYMHSAAAAAAAAAAALCVDILLLLLQRQCCCLLLLFVVVCRMARFVAGSLHLIPVFPFSSFKRDLTFDGTPWQYYCVAFTASICLHPR